MAITPRTDEAGRPVVAVAMMSGGLDSTLAAALIARMGIEVHGVRFATGFSPLSGKLLPTDETDESGGDPESTDPRKLKIGADAEISFRVIDISVDFIRDVLDAPKYGFGKAMNPCIDCHMYMLRSLRPVMDEVGAHFVITGEVLGQRPMSQHKQALRIVEEQSGLKGLLIRPLSARHLDSSIPEQKGWVDRDQLLDIMGRSRKPQMALAEQYGVIDYPQPAGGCLLTDPEFSRRLKDLIHNTDKVDSLTPEDISLLKVGRHFRLPSGTKVVVGRNDAENIFMMRLVLDRWAVQVIDHGSPVTLVDPTASDYDLNTAAALTARYSQGRDAGRVRVELSREGTDKELEIEPLAESDADNWLI